MKIAVFYYSQTGQAATVAKNIFAGCNSSVVISYKQIKPIRSYPYPWGKYDFFDVFPETRLCLPPSGIEPIKLDDIKDAQLVIIVGQSWFLSPSLPLQSFFCDDKIKKYLHGRKVIFVNACRNMWLMTSRYLKKYFKDIHTEWIGHIVLQDNAPNLISATTIVRWLLHGQKESSLFLSAAGVAEQELKATSRFGHIILDAMQQRRYNSLQTSLLNSNAIVYKPSILFIEKIGYRIFGIWAKFIRKKGEMGDKKRRHSVMLFYYYLLFVLYIVSPFVQLFFYLTYPLNRVEKNKRIDTNV